MVPSADRPVDPDAHAVTPRPHSTIPKPTCCGQHSSTNRRYVNVGPSAVNFGEENTKLVRRNILRQRKEEEADEGKLLDRSGDSTPCRMTGVTLHTGLYPQTRVLTLFPALGAQRWGPTPLSHLPASRVLMLATALRVQRWGRT